MGKVNKNINPEEDGITHINMYSKAKTDFGKMLSDWYPYEFDSKDGHFASVEGYWYYMSLPETVNRDKMRTLTGFAAKDTGRKLRAEAAKIAGVTDKDYIPVFREDFEENILTAIESKIRDNWHLWKEEYKDLPVIHYYIMYDRPIDVTQDFKWLVDGINNIISEITAEKEKEREDR